MEASSKTRIQDLFGDDDSSSSRSSSSDDESDEDDCLPTPKRQRLDPSNDDDDGDDDDDDDAISERDTNAYNNNNNNNLWESRIGVYDDTLTLDECHELIAVHESELHHGYMDSFCVTRIADLPRPLGLVVARARYKVWQKVEEHFPQHSLEVFPEFTALTSWRKGAVLQPHYDSNRDYLKDRHYSAILYLNSPSSSSNDPNRTFDPNDYHRAGFEGGDLVFSIPGSNRSKRISPQAGRVVCFPSSKDYVHGVESVREGRRYSLTLWFTLRIDARETLESLLSPEAMDIGQPWESPQQAQELLEETLARANAKDFLPTKTGAITKVSEWKQLAAYCWWKEGLPLGDANEALLDRIHKDWKDYLRGLTVGLESATKRWKANGWLVAEVLDEEVPSHKQGRE